MATVTIGGTTYDVYADVAVADAWLKASISAAAWQGATEDTKKMALVSSTRWIDSQQWIGEKTSPSQPLAWPRTGISGVDPDTVPPEIIQSCIELAGMLVENPSLITEITSGGATETKRLKAGSAEIEYFKNFNLVKYSNRFFPVSIFNLLRKWMVGAGDLGVAGSESYDTCRPSRFSSWGFNQGF